MYFLIGWAVTHGVGRWGRAWAAAMVVPILVVGAAFYWPSTALSKAGSASTAELVNERWQPGDVIYHATVGTMMEFWPYTEHPNYLLPGDDGGLGGLTPVSRAAMGMQERPLDQLVWRRAWLIWVSGPVTPDFADKAARALLARYRNEQVMILGNGKTIDGGVYLLWR